METLPQEMLGAIAQELSIADLRHFRLVGRRYADAGFPALVQKISFLNTLDTADELRTLSQSPYGSLGATRHLTIYDGDWPVATSQKDWASLFLFLSSRSDSDPTATRLAYHRYDQFIRQETSRTFDTDVHFFRTVLDYFPSLTELTLSHVHAWRMRYLEYAHFHNLTNRIWVIPEFESWVARGLSRLFPVLGTLSRLQRLNVEGLLDARDLVVAPELYQFNTIRHLCLSGIQAGEGLDESIANFLGAFPQLTTLSIRTYPRADTQHQNLPLQQMRWPDLQVCEISSAWLPENELFSFTKFHPLKRLILKSVTLSSGSWKSFFTRVRELKPQPGVICQCIFSSSWRRNERTWDTGYFDTRQILKWFMADVRRPWPFSDKNDILLTAGFYGPDLPPCGLPQRSDRRAQWKVAASASGTPSRASVLLAQRRRQRG